MIRNVAESNIESGKIEIEVERNDRIVLGRGKCKNMILVKLNLLINLIKIGEKFPYELDLREIPKDDTYLQDPKTRDFTVNSGYYSISEAKVIDISNVT